MTRTVNKGTQRQKEPGEYGSGIIAEQPNVFVDHFRDGRTIIMKDGGLL